MSRSHLTLHIPQPCAESWDAMTPTALGRHCAACQKTVVDFTQKTDAEILAYLAKAKGETCGRLYNDQLTRPLVPAASPTTVSSRWRTWLALALAAWGASRTESPAHAAPPLTHKSPRKLAPQQRRMLAVKYVHGTVRNPARQPLAGVAVFLRGENRMVITDSAGRFRLQLSARRPRGGRALVLHFAGYLSETVRVPATTRATSLALTLQHDSAADGAQIIGDFVRQERYMTSGSIATIVVGEAEPATKPVSPTRGLFRRWFNAVFH